MSGRGAERLIAGVDVGGTKTAVGLFKPSGEQVAHTAFASLPEQGFDSLVKRIGAAYRALRADFGAGQVAAAGVACPGPLDLQTGRIVHIATMGFRDEPVRDALSAELGLPVFLENDANCAALAEARAAHHTGPGPLVYVTISTGIGSGVVIDGKIVDGAASSAGELGHLTVKRGGRACACGKRGCLERYASGTAIAELASRAKGEPIAAKDAFARMRAGDEDCARVIRAAVDHLGYAVAAVCQLLDPERIVFGGSVSKDFDVILPLLNEAVSRYAQPGQLRRTRLCRSQLSGDPCILGAVYYAVSRLEPEDPALP